MRTTCKAITLFLAFMSISIQGLAEYKANGKIFKINAPVNPPAKTKNNDGFEDLLAIELYTRLGFKPVITSVPAQRGLLNLNQGIDDGILTRVAGLEKNYPNIVQMNEHANERDYIAFARRKDIKINNWDDFEPYNVAMINGWKIFEKNIKKYKSLVKVRGPEQLFNLLASERVDVVVYARTAGDWMLKKMNLKDIHAIEPPLAKKKKYFYLHKRHAHLVPKADAIMRQIKEDGTYDALKRKSVQMK